MQFVSGLRTFPHIRFTLFSIFGLLDHDGRRSNTSEVASHSDVLRIRRRPQLTPVLAAAVIRERAEKLTRRSYEHLKCCVAARAGRLDA